MRVVGSVDTAKLVVSPSFNFDSCRNDSWALYVAVKQGLLANSRAVRCCDVKMAGGTLQQVHVYLCFEMAAACNTSMVRSCSVA